VNDARTAQQFGVMIIIPLSALLVAQFMGAVWLSATALGLIGLVAIQIRWAVAFVRWPIEIMYGEALIQDHAARLFRGEALYQALGQPSYTVAAYTPLFYGLVALGQAAVGPSLLVARVVSLIATTLTAGLLGYVAARQGRGLAAGVLAALLFVGLGFPTPFPWFGLGKEDAFGVGPVEVFEHDDGASAVGAPEQLVERADQRVGPEGGGAPSGQQRRGELERAPE